MKTLPDPFRIKVSDFKARVADGEMLPGTHVLVEGGERGLLNFLIAAAQRMALKDLGGVSSRLTKAAAAYTHAAVVFDEDRVAELYHPEARFRDFAKLSGRRLALLTPSRTEALKAGKTVEKALADVAVLAGMTVAQRERYPVAELLYYLKWTTKRLRSLLPFVRRRSFFDLFRDDRYNVCSGAVWRWDTDSGLFADAGGCDAMPEAWYPARFLADDRFEVRRIYDLEA